MNKFIEVWTPSGTLTDGEISQKLNGVLPAGFYRLEADCKSSGSQGVTLAVTDGSKVWSTPVNTSDPAHFAVDFESDGTNILTVGLFVKDSNSSWVCADNFALYCIGISAPDGIGEIKSEELRMKNSQWFDLAGRRVSKLVKGVYITNGKKTLIK